MITQPLLEYIERQFGRNIPREDILKKLLEAGWDKKDAAEGMDTIETKLGKIVSSAPTSSLSSPEEGGTKKSIVPLILLIIGIVFVLGAIGALAYWKYALDMKPLSTIFTKVSSAQEQLVQPQETLENALGESGQAATTSTTTQVLPDSIKTELSPLWGDWKGEVMEVPTGFSATVPLVGDGGSASVVSTELVPKYTESQLSALKAEFMTFGCGGASGSMLQIKIALVKNLGIPESSITEDNLFGLMMHPQIAKVMEDTKAACQPIQKPAISTNGSSTITETTPVVIKSLSFASIESADLKGLSDMGADISYTVSSKSKTPLIHCKEVAYLKANGALKTPPSISCGLVEQYVYLKTYSHFFKNANTAYSALVNDPEIEKVAIDFYVKNESGEVVSNKLTLSIVK